jgi:hypothetical protein
MNEPPEQRQPVVHEKEMTAIVGASAVTAELSVERGLNDTRLAVLAILVGIGLTVGFGVPGPWWVGLVAGACSFVAGCVLIRWKFSRRRLMSFMHWLAGS